MTYGNIIFDWKTTKQIFDKIQIWKFWAIEIRDDWNKA